MVGVHAGQRLSFGHIGKAYQRKLWSPTGLGKSDRPERNEGLAEPSTTVKAKRPRKAETPKQPTVPLGLRAP